MIMSFIMSFIPPIAVNFWWCMIYLSALWGPKKLAHNREKMGRGMQKFTAVFYTCLQSVFIKDSLSLGYYNFTASTVVQLALKERGGRKK